MNQHRYSVAMSGPVEESLTRHLCRYDGDEDLCLAIYTPSTGSTRFTGLITQVLLPKDGDRIVSGTVEFSGEYVLRVATQAAKVGGGVAILHSHPHGEGWQWLSTFDRDAETSYAALVQELTSLPLLGMTYAGIDGTWSARFWPLVQTVPSEKQCVSVRVIGDHFGLSWNSALVPIPPVSFALSRTVSCWGLKSQADFARLRILIVGVGTLGLDIALRFAAAGVQQIGLMDFDSIEVSNLDRLIGASLWDVWLGRSKVEHAERVLRRNATAQTFTVESIESSVCEKAAIDQLLDYDLVVCTIDDHPWPRSILNAIAYTDLIPVIDGGVHIDTFPQTGAMRNATWRSHVLRPGRPCMACNGQLELGTVLADKEGVWDDEEYLAGVRKLDRPQRQNVGLFAAGASAGILAQAISYIANPCGLGDPGPIRFSLSTHWLEHLDVCSGKHCVVESPGPIGNQRELLLAEHPMARLEIRHRQCRAQQILIRLAKLAERCVHAVTARRDFAIARYLSVTTRRKD